MFRFSYKTDRTVKSAALLLFALAMVSAPSPLGATAFEDVRVTYWTGLEPGEGVNEALMVVDWQEPDQDSLVFGYRWIGQEQGVDMLNAIEGADSRFHVYWHPYYIGALYGIGWDADGDGFSPTDPDDYYQAGWEYYEDGYWSSYSSTDGETWSYGGFGAHGTDLSDGDYSGWSWSPGFESSAPDNLPAASTVGILGDSNGDLIVDINDYVNLLAQFGQTAPVTDSADFNGDNIIDLKDFAILRRILSGSASSPSSPGLVASTPEPATLLILALGASSIFAHRRRR